MFDKPWDHYIVMNKDNMTEFKDPKYRDLLLPYFKERNEDIPLDEAIELSQNPTRVITTNETTEQLSDQSTPTVV
jgi:hypothetical protein